MKISEKLKKTVSIIIVAIGLISSIISVFTANFNQTSLIIGGIVITLTIVCALAWEYFGPKDSLPSGIEIVAEALDGNNSIRNIRIIFPCDVYYYKAANKLAKEKFGKNSASTSAANDWQKKNEYILTCLCDNNIMVGYFDILPLKSEFAQRFIQGSVTEKDIRAEHLYAVHEMKKARYVYFAGIAVKNTSAGAGCIYATYLIYAALLYLKTFYHDSDLETILTIPTSKEGLEITKKFFTLERGADLRGDNMDLYSRLYNTQDFVQIIEAKRALYDRFDASAYLNVNG